MWLLLLSAVARGSNCPEHPDVVALQQATATGVAFDNLDEEALADSERRLDFALGCLDAPLGPRAAVEVHRAKALTAFFSGENAAALRSWAAVKVLDPVATPSAARWPRAHPMWRLFADAPTSDEWVQLERTPPGGWVVDGDARSDVPRDRAFLLQALDAQGTSLMSGYLYSVAEVPQLDFAELDPTARRRRRKRMHIIGTTATGAAGATALTLFVVATVARFDVTNPNLPYGRIDKRAEAANTLATASAGTALGALGLGVATFTIRW